MLTTEDSYNLFAEQYEESEVIRLKTTHYKDYRNRKDYRYFISYTFGGGFGNVEVRRYEKFKNIHDVKQWARNYEKEMNFIPNSLVVLNFQLF